MTEFNPQSLNQLDRSRLAGYKTNLDFYDGSQWAERSRNRQLVFNYSKIAIDKVTSYLMQGLKFACDPVDDSDGAKERAQRAEEVLYSVYQDNNHQERQNTLAFLPDLPPAKNPGLSPDIPHSSPPANYPSVHPGKCSKHPQRTLDLCRHPGWKPPSCQFYDLT